MQTRTLTILPTILLLIGLVVLGLTAVLHAHSTVSRVESATIDTKMSQSGQSATTAATQAPDVTVNGQHISVPANGSMRANLSEGGQVQVTTSQNGGSSDTAAPSDSSVQVSTQVDSNNQSNTSSHTEVYSSSYTQVSNQSNDQVYSTGTSNVQITH